MLLLTTAITSERFLTASYLKEGTGVKRDKELFPSTITDPYNIHTEIIAWLGNSLKNT